MSERRDSPRERVMYGAHAIAANMHMTPCVVRNISKYGAKLQFSPGVYVPSHDVTLKVERIGMKRPASIVWREKDTVGVSFADEPAANAPATDLAARLRAAEAEKRRLRLKLDAMMGE